MIVAQLRQMREEWRHNRRLRLGALAILMILGTYAVLTLSDRQHAMAEAYERDAGLAVRLEQVAREQEWPRRADQAEATLARLVKSIPETGSDGAAQADIHAWLTEQAVEVGLESPQVRVEATVAVPDHPELRQVLARLDATLPEGKVDVLARALSAGLPWIQTERLEIVPGPPGRVMVIVRAYSRKSAAELRAAAAVAGGDAP